MGTDRFLQRHRPIPYRIIASTGAALILLLTGSAHAQYSFDPNNADEKGYGVKYFGAAKDERGAMIPGATIEIAHYFTLVTDDQGRFRANVDPAYASDKTPVGCFKPGYDFDRIVKRPGPAGGVKQTVQVDCFLRRKH